MALQRNPPISYLNCSFKKWTSSGFFFTACGQTRERVHKDCLHEDCFTSRKRRWGVESSEQRSLFGPLCFIVWGNWLQSSIFLSGHCFSFNIKNLKKNFPFSLESDYKAWVIFFITHSSLYFEDVFVLIFFQPLQSSWYWYVHFHLSSLKRIWIHGCFWSPRAALAVVGIESYLWCLLLLSSPASNPQRDVEKFHYLCPDAVHLAPAFILYVPPDT